MATATQQPNHHHSFPHNGMNGHGAKYVAHRPAEDDDSIATEQFPEFDPSHDGSEEEEQDVVRDRNYTHRRASQTANGGATRGEGQEQGAPKASKAQEEAQQNNHRPLFDDDDGSSRRDLLSVDPRPESNRAPSQLQHQDEPQSAVTSVTSPPYWAHNHASSGHGHPFANHHNENLSTESLVPGAITLQDNEAEEDDADNSNDLLQAPRNSDETRTSYGRDRNKACWAKSVEVTDYVTVNGSATNIGAFVVWNIRVQTLSGPYMNIRKRYSEFDDFRHQLIQSFPAFEAAVPVLPPKSVISKFRPRFLEKRRAGLQYFLNCILLNPEFSGSPVLKDFLFA